MKGKKTDKVRADIKPIGLKAADDLFKVRQEREGGRNRKEGSSKGERKIEGGKEGREGRNGRGGTIW